MARIVAISAWTAVLAFGFSVSCSSGEDGTTGASSGSGGSGTTTGSTATTSAASSTTGAGPVTGAGGGGGAGGGSAFVCDPPAEAGSIFELNAESLDVEQIDPVSMCKYRGDVMLIVNTAAVCGYTPQMEGLQSLQEKFAAEGFTVLGFLSNDFGNQGGSDGEIEACTDKYNVSFDQFAIDHVKGPDVQPVFGWLLGHQNPGPASNLEPTWNFHKYLVSRDGKLIANWDTDVYPGDDPNNADDSFDTNPIVTAIKAELAK